MMAFENNRTHWAIKDVVFLKSCSLNSGLPTMLCFLSQARIENMFTAVVEVHPTPGRHHIHRQKS